MNHSSLWREFESGEGPLLRLLRVLILVGGLFFLISTGMMELTWPQQIILDVLIVPLAVWMDRSSSSYLVTLTLGDGTKARDLMQKLTTIRKDVAEKRKAKKDENRAQFKKKMADMAEKKPGRTSQASRISSSRAAKGLSTRANCEPALVIRSLILRRVACDAMMIGCVCHRSGRARISNVTRRPT